MNDSEPGGSPIFLLQSYPGIAVSFLLAVFFAFLYAYAVAYTKVLPSINDDELEEAAENGSKKAEQIIHSLADRRKFLHKMQTLKLTALLIMSWSFAYTVNKLSQKLLASAAEFWTYLISLLAVLILVFLLLSFTQNILSLKVQKQAMEFAFRSHALINIFASLLEPIAELSLNISDNILRKNEIDPADQKLLFSEKELKEILESNSEQEENMFLENVFSIGDKTVAECMTHRMDMVTIEDTATLEEVIRIIDEEKFTRIPVYHEDVDKIIGLVYARDVLILAARQDSANFNIVDILREPHFVPESQSITKLFKRMQQEKMHIAIVIDEYGGTAGLITMEDVLEEIVGQIEDEYDEQELDFVALNDKQWVLNSVLSLEEVEEFVDIDLPSEDYDTVAGFVIALLDRIPREDERPEVCYGDYKFKVLTMEDKRIEQVLLTYSPQESQAETIEELTDVL